MRCSFIFVLILDVVIISLVLILGRLGVIILSIGLMLILQFEKGN